MPHGSQNVIDLLLGPDPLLESDGAHPTIADYLAMQPHPQRVEGGKRPTAAAAPQTFKVTVITPVRNGELHLEKMIRSVVTQSYDNIEFIIVDGCSTDRTIDILRSYEQDISLWISEPDLGMYDAINKGIALSQGRLTKILNADDVLPPHSVETAVQNYVQLDDEDCVLKGNMAVIDTLGSVLGVLDDSDRASYLPAGFPILHPSWYVPRVLYQRMHLYSTRYRVASDYEFFHRLLRSGVTICHIPETMVHFRVGGVSSGFNGLLEGWEINRHYLGQRRAVEIMVRTALKKARSRALTKIFGETRAVRIQSYLRQASRKLKGGRGSAPSP